MLGDDTRPSETPTRLDLLGDRRLGDGRVSHTGGGRLITRRKTSVGGATALAPLPVGGAPAPAAPPPVGGATALAPSPAGGPPALVLPPVGGPPALAPSPAGGWSSPRVGGGESWIENDHIGEKRKAHQFFSTTPTLPLSSMSGAGSMGAGGNLGGAWAVTPVGGRMGSCYRNLLPPPIVPKTNRKSLTTDDVPLCTVKPSDVPPKWEPRTQKENLKSSRKELLSIVRTPTPGLLPSSPRGLTSASSPAEKEIPLTIPSSPRKEIPEKEIPEKEILGKELLENDFVVICSKGTEVLVKKNVQFEELNEKLSIEDFLEEIAKKEDVQEFVFPKLRSRKRSKSIGTTSPPPLTTKLRLPLNTRSSAATTANNNNKPEISPRKDVPKLFRPNGLNESGRRSPVVNTLPTQPAVQMHKSRFGNAEDRGVSSGDPSPLLFPTIKRPVPPISIRPESPPRHPRPSVFRNLSIWIIKAEDLGEEGSCYAVVRIHENDIRRTSVVPCSKPIFAKKFSFLNYEKNQFLKIEVWHSGEGGQPKLKKSKSIKALVSPRGGREVLETPWCLGVAVVPLEDLTPGTTELWLPLSDPKTQQPTEHGKIKIKYFLTETKIREETAYTDFIELLTHPELHLLSLLEGAISLEDRTTVAKYVMRIFFTKNRWKFYAENIIATELERCRDVGTLFRESSVATATLYYLLNRIGRDYLQNTLRPPIEAILNKKSFFVQTLELEDSDRQMLSFLKMVMDAIFHSWDKFPPVMNFIFRALQKQTLNKFGENASIRGVTGFLFLRFFVPSIRSPAECGIIPGQVVLGSKEAEGLGVLAGIVQKLANMTLFREGERFYFANDFLRELQNPLREYVERVTAEVSEKTLEEYTSEGGLDANLAEDCACLIGYFKTTIEYYKNKQNDSQVASKIVTITNLLTQNDKM